MDSNTASKSSTATQAESAHTGQWLPIRPMQPEDEQSVANINKAAFANSFHKPGLRKFSDFFNSHVNHAKGDAMYRFVLEKGEKVIGYIGAHHEKQLGDKIPTGNKWTFPFLRNEIPKGEIAIEPCVHIEAMAIDPAEQNNGHGKQLLKYLMDKVKNDFPNEAMQMCASLGNKKALALYKQCGFQEVMRDRKGYSSWVPHNEVGQTQIMMQKPANSAQILPVKTREYLGEVYIEANHKTPKYEMDLANPPQNLRPSTVSELQKSFTVENFEPDGLYNFKLANGKTLEGSSQELLSLLAPPYRGKKEAIERNAKRDKNKIIESLLSAKISARPLALKYNRTTHWAGKRSTWLLHAARPKRAGTQAQSQAKKAPPSESSRPTSMER